MWRPLAVALALLTRWPVKVAASGDASESGRSALWYPAVGLLIGLVLAGICLVSRSAPATVGGALALVAWCLMTGGLHLDGLSDSADAFIGSHGDPSRALRIMKDAAAGPMGVVAVCVLLIVKFSALAALSDTQEWMPIVLAPVLGRAAVVALLLDTPYVRPGGIGETIAEHLPRGPARLVLTGVLAATVVAGGVAIVIGAGLAFLVLRRLMLRTIGGATGDTAGALVEVTEAAVLVAATF